MTEFFRDKADNLPKAQTEGNQLTLGALLKGGGPQYMDLNQLPKNDRVILNEAKVVTSNSGGGFIEFSPISRSQRQETVGTRVKIGDGAVVNNLKKQGDGEIRIGLSN